MRRLRRRTISTYVPSGGAWIIRAQVESIVRVYFIEGWVRVRCVEQRRPPSPPVVVVFGLRWSWVPAKFVVPFPGWLFPKLWVRIAVVAFATNGVGVIKLGHVDLLTRCQTASLQLKRWSNIASLQLTPQHIINSRHST